MNRILRRGRGCRGCCYDYYYYYFYRGGKRRLLLMRRVPRCNPRGLFRTEVRGISSRERWKSGTWSDSSKELAEGEEVVRFFRYSPACSQSNTQVRSFRRRRRIEE